MQSEAAPPKLPRPIVIYDGTCRFCLRQIDGIRRRDKAKEFDYVPIQNEDIEKRFPRLTEGDFNTGMRLIRTDGTIMVAADAVYEIARCISVYRWFAWLYCVPGLKWCFRRLYDWVAANRYRLGKTCGDGKCKI